MPLPLIERYRDRLSLEQDDPVVTLNEGSTPLIHSPRLSAMPRAIPPAKPSLRSSEISLTSGNRSRTSSTEPSCEPLSTTITSVSSSTA